MGVRELARAVDVPRATVQRLLAVLERRGFVQSERGRYQLGSTTISLARAFLTTDSLGRSALPVLQELAVASGETTSLYLRRGFDRIVAQRVDSSHHLRYSIQIGQRLPLHVGAAGLVLAAGMAPEDLQRLLDQVGDIHLATGEMLSRGDWLARLDQVRRQGYATSLGEREVGVVSVSAPIVRRDGETIAAIAVLGPPSRMPQEKIEYLSIEVRRSARQIAESYSQA